MKVDGKEEEETEKPIKRKNKIIAELTYKQRFHSIFLGSSLGVRTAELTLLFLLFLYFSRESFERFPHKLTWITEYRHGHRNRVTDTHTHIYIYIYIYIWIWAFFYEESEKADTYHIHNYCELHFIAQCLSFL